MKKIFLLLPLATLIAITQPLNARFFKSVPKNDGRILLSKKMMRTPFSSAKKICKSMLLLKYGLIEITTKNETNTLYNTPYKPHAKAEVPEAQQDEYNDKCLAESRLIATLDEDPYYSSTLNYSLEKTLNHKFSEKINHPGRLFSILIEDYFQQTDSPQPNDLVIYTHTKNDTIICHVATMIDDTTVESKWGSEIHHHKLLNIPTGCGNAAWFYTLKKEYAGTQGRENIITELEDSLQLQKEILTEIVTRQAQ